jgi:hypothetical protein
MRRRLLIKMSADPPRIGPWHEERDHVGSTEEHRCPYQAGRDQQAGDPAVLARHRCAHRAAETFGINVFKVREVMRTPPITSAPEMPVSVEGMVSLRGALVPVVDLARYAGSIRRRRARS